MLKYNASILGLASIAVVAFSAEARASCFSGPGTCLCGGDLNVNAAFTGTILEGKGDIAHTPGAFKIRVDEVTVPSTSSTELMIGSTTEARVVNIETTVVRPGDRVIGFSVLTCADPNGDDCSNQPKNVEVLTLSAVFTETGFVACGTSLFFSSSEARELLVNPDCRAEISKRLGPPGPDDGTCDDGGACLCSATGGRSAGGAPAALGLLALVGTLGRRRARR